MKKLLSASLLSIAAAAAAALAPAPAQAQVLCALGPAALYDPLADMPASASAQAELKKVKALLCPKGCGKVLLIANATAPNSATVSDGAGASKITYNPAFVGNVQKTYGPAGTFGLVAHQLGHHLDTAGTRPPWMKETWDSELRADAWAGCAMAKAELRPSGLQAVLLALSTYPSAHHPAWAARRAVITEGFTRCGGRVLPPLAKEAGEPPAKTEAGKDELASAAPGPGGCTGDKDCRNGRACVSSHCVVAPARKRCGKDTDCPDPEECDAGGLCVSPAGAARAEEDSKKTGAMLASLQGERPAASAPVPLPAATSSASSSATPSGATASAPASATASAPATTPVVVATASHPGGETNACLRSCDDVRNQCVEAATSEANKCLSAIQSEQATRACSCPNYPAGDYNCYRVCSAAYERGKSCSSSTLVRDCRTDGNLCRSQCR